MTRRFHTPTVKPGLNQLDAKQGKHARDVLRLEEGAEVELFDDAGTIAPGVLVYEGSRAAVRIISASASVMRSFAELTVAAAIPKGERADWMVEKLSELGVAKLVPLETDRGVVRPEGTHKRERWQRIATESAKQSRRSGVMRIEPTATVESQLPESPLICLATEVDAEPLAEVVQSLGGATKVRLLIGPEGGWTAEELQSFRSAGATFARMTETILRIETAAVAAAAVTAMLLKPR